MRIISQGTSFAVAVVEADSVADYLDRYYKPSRRTPDLLASYEDEYASRGYVCTSHHDNVTGHFIYWPSHPSDAEAADLIAAEGE
jgi:hypothetical protein